MGRRRSVRWGLWLLVTAASVALASVSVGHAASLAMGSKSLGAQSAAVPKCDTDGFTLVHNLSVSNVVSVTVGSIAAACAAGVLSVTVNNGLTNSSGSATVPAGGGSLTVTLALPVLAADVEQVDVSVVGP